MLALWYEAAAGAKQRSARSATLGSSARLRSESRQIGSSGSVLVIPTLVTFVACPPWSASLGTKCRLRWVHASLCRMLYGR